MALLLSHIPFDQRDVVSRVASTIASDATDLPFVEWFRPTAFHEFDTLHHIQTKLPTLTKQQRLQFGLLVIQLATLLSAFEKDSLPGLPTILVS